MEERRRYKRFSLDIMDIHGKMLCARNIKILDISLGGILFAVDRNLKIGNEYSLRIEWKGRDITVKGVVVWAFLSLKEKDFQGNSIPMYAIGMQFLNVKNEEIKNFVDFIEEHKTGADKLEQLYKLSGNRIFVRFQIRPPEKARLHIQDTYKVQQISSSGMLIESKYALEIEDILPMVINFDKKQSIKLSGRIVSSHLVSNKLPERYSVGIEFIGMSESDKAVLIKFIRQLDT